MADYSSAEAYLHSKLSERRQEIEAYMGRGQVKDYAEYRQLCGLIQGLEFAEQLVSDLAKRHQDAENDE